MFGLISFKFHLVTFWQVCATIASREKKVL